MVLGCVAEMEPSESEPFQCLGIDPRHISANRSLAAATPFNHGCPQSQATSTVAPFLRLSFCSFVWKSSPLLLLRGLFGIWLHVEDPPDTSCSVD